VFVHARNKKKYFLSPGVGLFCRRLRCSFRLPQGFTLLELVMVIGLVTIVTAGMASLISPFEMRQRFEYSTVKLVGDLRQARQFAYSQRVGNTTGTEYAYKYYGLYFNNSLGEDSDRQGWKIVRYEPPGGVTPEQMDPTQAGHLNLTRYTVIKGSQAAENPELSDNTFFSQGVMLDASSDFQIGGLQSVVFTPEGSATTDGINLLSSTQDDVIISTYGRNKTIHITSLTGHIAIQ